MTRQEFHSGEAVPEGVCLQLNVFGVPTSMTVTVRQGDMLPAVARLPYELRDMNCATGAAFDRHMAGTATTERVRDDLLAVAQRFDVLEDRRDAS